MSPARDYYSEMHRLLIDDATAERLLRGRLPPEDAPPGYGSLAGLLRAAAGPASQAELAGEATVVPAGVDAVRSSPTPLQLSRRRTVLSKVLTAKVLAAATVATFGLGGVAAAASTGNFPGQSSHANSHAAFGLVTAASHHGATGATNPPGHAKSNGATSSNATPSGATTSLPLTGPANVHAQFGLCTAFLAGPNGNGSSTSTPPKDSSTAFKALINQNGGVAGTITYCKKVVTTQHPGASSSSGATGAAASPGNSGQAPGRPASPGKSSQAHGASHTQQGQSTKH